MTAISKDCKKCGGEEFVEYCDECSELGFDSEHDVHGSYAVVLDRVCPVCSGQVEGTYCDVCESGVFDEHAQRRKDKRDLVSLVDRLSVEEGQRSAAPGSFETERLAKAAMVKYCASSAKHMTCLAYACHKAGVTVDPRVISVAQIDEAKLDQLSKKSNYRIYLISFAPDDHANHVELVTSQTGIFRTYINPVGRSMVGARVESVTSMQHFFTKGDEWYQHKFYADVDSAEEQYGDSSPYPPQPSASVPQPASGPAVRPATGGFGGDLPYGGPSLVAAPVPAPQSVVDETVQAGGSNVSGGVQRNRRRLISAKSGPTITHDVARSYHVSGPTRFNNLEEMFQDMISREYAQEIMEEVFDAWGLPRDQPSTMRFAEDLLFAFMIANTASNKADYNKSFDIPIEPSGVVVVSFSVLSNVLSSGHGKTRRQFSRGIADDQRAYLKREENVHVLPRIATRIGCEPGMAYLGFDGSTHCTGMTTREEAFTKTLESRNLFERDDIVAQGASDRLMQGMSSGTRAVSSR